MCYRPSVRYSVRLEHVSQRCHSGIWSNNRLHWVERHAADQFPPGIVFYLYRPGSIEHYNTAPVIIGKNEGNRKIVNSKESDSRARFALVGY